MFFYNLKIAFRNLLRHKQSSLLNILGLVIALTVSFIILFYFLFERSEDRFHYKAKDIYKISIHDNFWGFDFNQHDWKCYDKLLKTSSDVEAVFRENWERMPVEQANGEYKEENPFVFVDTVFFKYIKFHFITGNANYLDLESIVISEAVAEKYFGTNHCINQTINVRGHNGVIHPFLVKGVFKETQNSSFHHWRFIANLESFELLDSEFKMYDPNQDDFARIVLADNANKERLLATINKIFIEENDKEYAHENKSDATLKPLVQIEKKIKVQIFTLVGFLVLVISVFNFIILSNAVFIEKAKAFGVKKVIGAYTKHLLNQTFSESLILSVVACAIAFGLALIALPFVKELLNPRLSVTVFSPLIIVGCTILIILFITITTSISSLLMATRFQPIKLLNKTFLTGNKRTNFSNGLIIFQVTVFTTLIIVLIAINQQIKFLDTADWGFKKEHLIKMELPRDLNYNNYLTLKDNLMKIPEVERVSGASNIPPTNSSWVFGFSFTEMDGTKKDVKVERIRGDIDFLKTFGCELINGRMFEQSDKNGSPRKIIASESFTKLYGFKYANDTIISLYESGPRFQVIGIIKDLHFKGFDEEVPLLTIQYGTDEIRESIIRISSTNVKATLEQIKKVQNDIFKTSQNLEISFVEDEVAQLYESEKQFSKALSIFTIVAVLISCFGLFSFVLNVINSRIKEVGVRKVNGAKIIEIVTMLNQTFISWVFIAFFIACPIAYYLIQKWLEYYVYKIEIGVNIFIIAVLSATFCTLLTVSWQCYRAASRNPVEALRYE